jgi:hypothetical protein
MRKHKWSDVAAWRLRRHHLDRRARPSTRSTERDVTDQSGPERVRPRQPGLLIAVASRLCGLHAQLMSSAELSAWARVDALDRDAVQRALWHDRTLVKT